MLLPRCPRLITRKSQPVAQASRLGLRALALASIAFIAPSSALAQLTPTPGAPSLPLLAPGLANGVQGRITYQHGIEFVTIGAPGNPAWAGNNLPGDMAVGRGSVGYEYRIGRYEITTTQWVEFMNAAYDRPQSDWLPHLRPPDGGHWGAVATNPTVPGGLRWNVAAAAGSGLRGVGDISWRMAVMYCNWLHNDKSLSRDAFLSGAYDVSTFGFGQQFGFSDQLTRSANAKFFIPSWDEWIKAAHYDPNKNGQGQGGYWINPIAQDTLLAYAPPGIRVNPATGAIDPSGTFGQANAGFRDQYPGVDPFRIALGAYANVAQSPWGLLDAAGATTEWTEGAVLLDPSTPLYRIMEGSTWRLDTLSSARAGDSLPTNGARSDFPSTALYNNGFRIAALIPNPSTFLLTAVVALGYLRRTRRSPACAISSQRASSS